MPDNPNAPSTPAAGPAAAPTASDTAGGPPRSVKVMALLIALLCGIVGALCTFILFRHLGAGTLVALGSSGAVLLGVSGAVKVFEEKLGVL
ncbi:hypothetical protein [Streptomyces sp. NPDC047014]|uniref:hypothetical protein n=1 Tax=Streptomyces sp. NPDC047014 TaxID=3155736 RepID=UPI00340D616C